MTKSFVIAATHSGAGKTTITMGILRTLVNKGFLLQPFKVGPDYIDPAFHTYVTGNRCRNLDSWMLEEDKVKFLYNKNAYGKEIAVVEGVMGLFDGHSSNTGEGSTAHVSKIINSDVVLVIDGSGMAMSAGALVKGYVDFDKDVKVKYIIVNKVNSLNHYQIIKDAIEKHNDVKCIGYMLKNQSIQLKSRHLGLIPSVEVKDLDEKLDIISESVKETIDIDFLIDSLEDIDIIKKDIKVAEGKIRLAVAYDEAFNFYYHDNIDFLEENGAEIVNFSPIKDTKLPEDIDGIYIGGGFPEIFAKKLQLNVELREDILRKSRNDLPIYAECGGLMYLSKSIKDLDGNTYNMVGVFDNEVVMTKSLKRFGYVDVEILKDCILGSRGDCFRAHEFHRSQITSDKKELVYNIKKTRNNLVSKVWNCGYMENSTLAQYAHVHFYAAPDVGRNFIKSCLESRRNRRG